MRQETISYPCMLLLAAAAMAGGVPSTWESRGIGAGGATFAPVFSPFNSNELYLACDMGDLFHTTNQGASWQTVDFNQLQAFHSTEVQFTSDPRVLVALNYYTPGGTGVTIQVPAYSMDGGTNWTRLNSAQWPYGSAYRVVADPQTTNRLFVGTWSNIYYSANGGASFTLVAAAPTNRLAGAFFDAPRIFLACASGLIVSTNDGASFFNAGMSGLATGTLFFSFAGATQTNTTRLYCVTTPPAIAIPDGAPTISAANHVYAMNWGDPGWTLLTNGLTANDFPLLVAASRHDIATVYLGAGKTGAQFPDNNSIFKTTNAGASWTSVFLVRSNANIATGWGGYNPVYPPVNYSPPYGLAVHPEDPALVVRTDQGGLLSLSTNGGAGWRAVYALADDLNPTNAAIPVAKPYHGIGLEPTACWWVHWTSPTNLLAAFSDLRLIRSSDGGASWAFDYTLAPVSNQLNDVWQILPGASPAILYAVLPGLWTPNGVYNSNDSHVDPQSGLIYVSTNSGRSWAAFKDLGEPAVAMALDPHDASRMYAATVDSTNGAIWLCTNLAVGATAPWQRLSAHPRMRGHPYNIQVLNDGNLVAGCGAGITDALRFTSSSGVFLCTNLTAALAGDSGAWVDRSATGMVYWTQDVVLDPFDPGQSNWYVGVWNAWGAPTNGYPNPLGPGGLYMTADRGLTWTRIFSNDAVSSCTFQPNDSNTLYVASHFKGLWVCTNLHDAARSFQPVAGYPFRQPQRIFFNPYNLREVWVTSNGNGLRVGQINPAAWFTGIQYGGAALQLSWQGDETGLTYAVESCTDLTAGAWSPVPPTSQWWTTRQAWTNPAPAGGAQFFRVRAQ